MNLIIDIGNSSTKLAVFSHTGITITQQLDSLIIKDIEKLKSQYPDLKYSILSSVAKTEPAILDYLNEMFSVFILLDADTPTPINNQYGTKETLGKDRIAAAVAANNIFPGHNVLVIDAGSALTFDLVTSEGSYIGGNISPGLRMRFKALNQNTRHLPFLSQRDDFMFLGNNTEEAIISGVQQGMILEIDGFIERMKTRFDEPRVILTGGDWKFFDTKLKSSIFVNQNLVLLGLNTILNFNVGN